MIKRASIFLRGEMLLFASMNVTVSGFGVVSEPVYEAKMSDNLNEIGYKLLQALDNSKENVPDSEMGKAHQALFKLAGVKSHKALETNTKSCQAYIDNENKIHFIPLKNMRPQRSGYAVVNVSLEIIKELPLNHDEVGMALLETLERCE